MDRARLVVGIGNPLQGADGFGPAVVERLRARADLPRDTTLLDAHTDLLGCLETFAAFDQVVLVDAFVGGTATGAVSIVDEATFSGWNSDSPDIHAVSAVLAVGLFRRLYAAPTTIVLVGLDASDIGRAHPLRYDQIDAGVAAVLKLIALPLVGHGHDDTL